MKNSGIILYALIILLLTISAFSFPVNEENHIMKMQLILNGSAVATETFLLRKLGESSLEISAKTLMDINYKDTVYKAKYQTTGRFNNLKVESYDATVTATNGKFHYSLKKLAKGFEIFFETPTTSNKKILNASDELYLLDNNIMWNWFLIVRALEKTKKDKLKVVIPQLSSHPMIDIPIFNLEVLDEYSENDYKFYILNLVNSQVIVKIDKNGKIVEILQGAFKVIQAK